MESQRQGGPSLNLNLAGKSTSLDDQLTGRSLSRLLCRNLVMGLLLDRGRARFL